MTMYSPARRGLIAMTGLLLALGHASLDAALSVPVGIVLEHNAYNQWGVRAGLSGDMLLANHPRLSLSYTTSRLEALAGNALKKDNILLTLGWHFRPGRLIDPFVDVDAGWTRFDLEDDVVFAQLPNTAAIADLRVGLECCLLDGWIRPWASAGYSVLWSSTVYPFVCALGIDVDVTKGVKK
jgi:hypothetical protein